jgi:hypothetical protein
MNNAECISDISYDMRGGRSSEPTIDYETLYRSAVHEIESLKHDNDVFRTSVAHRRNVNVRDVKIENDKVMVYP